MKVLFVCNQFPSEVSTFFRKDDGMFGGWISGYLNNIKNSITITYLVINKGSNSVFTLVNDNVEYIYLNYSDIDYLKSNIHDTDIIHMFGVEFFYINDFLNVVNLDKLIVSIQGLTSECAKIYYSSYKKYGKTNLIFDMYMKKMKKDMKKRGEDEISYLKRIKNVIGRTDFDYETVIKHNSNITYYNCNEIVRNDFYSGNWDLRKIKRHRIFVTQASYPIKGAHLIIEIARLLKLEYPRIEIVIGGENLLESNGILTKLKINYASYIKRLIIKYDLSSNVKFVGFLGAEEVKNEMLDSHVFLLASSLENSPNSLAEAMLLGLPCVATSVGGVANFTTDKEDSLLYPYDQIEKGVDNIISIFEDDNLALKLSENAKKNAGVYYSPIINSERLIQIYKELLNKL